MRFVSDLPVFRRQVRARFVAAGVNLSRHYWRAQKCSQHAGPDDE
jgi:hypothetical protein